MKTVFMKLGVGVLSASFSAALFFSYHATKLRCSKIDTDILELERHQQSYLEVVTPLSNVVNNEDKKFITGYIEGPRFWQKEKRGPKYWAKIAQSEGEIPHRLAIEILSRLHDLPDGVVYNTALACDTKTLVALARRKGTDMRFFIKPLKTFDESEPLSYQLYIFLKKLAFDNTVDICTKFYVNALLGKTSPINQFGGSSTNDVSDDDDTDISSLMRQAGLQPGVMSLANLTISALNVIYQQTMQPGQLRVFVYDNKGLQLLTRIWYVFHADEMIMSKLANILLNLSQDKTTHTALTSGGFLHLLASWMKSSNVRLVSIAASVLCNLSGEATSYSSGCYLLHPPHAGTIPPAVDVVFIHGINGSSFYTWRQHGSMNGTEYYTTCWPKDWLGDKFGGSVRILGLDYTANATYWEKNCPYDQDKRSINVQAKTLIDRLYRCNLGDRPIIWVGHSLGGLIIKRMLTLAENHQLYGKMLDQTKEVLFLGVPHRGSPLADVTSRSSYISFPTLEIQDISDVGQLTKLNTDFIKLAKLHKIACVNYLENVKLRITGRFNMFVVPKQCGEFELGENISIDDDHVSICKLRDRESPIYRYLCRAIQKYVKDSNSDGTQGPADS